MEKSKSKLDDDIGVKRGDRNVFADLGQPDAAAHMLKAELVAQIDRIIRERRMTQKQAAELLGLSQPDISRLLRGNFRQYSVERLLRLLTLLGRDIDITIRKAAARRPGRVNVEAA
jgi:predicted XRE-type DNA-binding protein